MKSKIFAILIPLLLLSSCIDGIDANDDIIWDMAPVNVIVHIQDPAGTNLLSPLAPGNLQGKKIIAEYQGQEYELNWDTSAGSRAYMPFFTGLTLQLGRSQSGDSFMVDQNKNFLSFGEFDGADNQDIAISLHIEGYPESWDISVSHRIKWKGNTPKVTNTATLDGKDIPHNQITITLQP